MSRRNTLDKLKERCDTEPPGVRQPPEGAAPQGVAIARPRKQARGHLPHWNRRATTFLCASHRHTKASGARL